MEGARFVDPEICRDYLIYGKIKTIGSLKSTLYGYKAGCLEDAEFGWKEVCRRAEESFLANATAMGADIAAHFKTVCVKNDLEGFIMLRGEAYKTIEPEN
ncbi:hypothetical protein HOG16_02220 [Candidatus Woesearchaeota archaeon]|jgi:hypothetical protein|nr:hypothetical protein [Candidatus Woesearchaeota archaeon]MBT4321829.1 hypothetical protein [Candidatus Woesearchaeota archaeon]